MGRIKLLIYVNVPFYIRFDETALGRVTLVEKKNIFLLYKKTMLNCSGSYQPRLDPFMLI